MIIKNYVTDIAAQMGIHLSQVSIVEGLAAGCSDVFLLDLTFGFQRVNALVYQSELENLQRGDSCDGLEVRIRSVMSQLKLSTEANLCV